MEPVDEAGGKECGIETRSSFGEQGEDALFNQVCRGLFRAGRGLHPQEGLRRGHRGFRIPLTPASSCETEKITTSFCAVATSLQSSGHAQRGIEDDAQKRATAA